MSVRAQRAGTVVTITIDRPEFKNAVDRATAEALAAAFRDFEADDEFRVAVLTGASGTFCSGADLKAVSRGEPNRIDPEGDAPMGPSRMLLSKPVVAAIAGHAVAGGLELACFCDLRVAERDAQLGVLCRRWGVPLIDGGTVRLPRIVGLGRALDLILTGRIVGAEEALAMGLVSEVVEKGESLARAQQLAEKIAAFPQVCMRSDRLSAYESLDLSLVDALRNEFARGMPALQAESLAGATRFAGGAGRGGAFEGGGGASEE